ncbi:MAG: hypothetical protein ACOCSK_00940 [Rhodothermales bacterium]
MAKQRHTSPSPDVLERGNIYFFYRPAIEQEQPERLVDLQDISLILSPNNSDVFRRIVIGQKTLPEPEEHGRHWAFVDLVTTDREEIRSALTETIYETQTRGTRHVPAARPAGEGVYSVARRGRETYLNYLLELPEEPDEVQQTLHIEPQARYVLAVKNPDISPELGLSETRRAEYPKELAERFRGRRWIAADPIDFLDYEGTELVLIGAREDAARLDPELEEREETENADIFDELQLQRSEHPVAPLFEGEWK